MKKADDTKPQWLTAMAAATRYGISTETLRHWVNWQDYPQASRRRDGQYMLYDVTLIDAWLRNRRVGSQGTRPKWLAVVGHTAAE